MAENENANVPFEIYEDPVENDGNQENIPPAVPDVLANILTQQLLAEQPVAPPQTYMDRLGEAMLEFNVGPELKVFYAHKKLVFDNAPWAKDHCEGMEALFGPGFGDLVTIPDFEPKGFDIFFEWLYTKQVVFPLLSNPEIPTAEPRPDIHAAAIAYSIGQLTESEKFQDALANKVKSSFRPPNTTLFTGEDSEAGELEFKEIVGAYGAAPENSPLRRLFLELALHYRLTTRDGPILTNCTVEEMGEMRNDYELELIRLDEANVMARDLWNPHVTSPCRYHVHGPDMMCTHGGQVFRPFSPPTP